MEGVEDTVWYTLGNDPTMYNITGSLSGYINQTGWDKVDNGTVIIHFYVNDSRNYIGNIDLPVLKDSMAPNITIIEPKYNKLFNATAPSYNLVFKDAHLNDTWYRIGNGTDWSINYTIGGLGSQRLGQINQDAWNDRPNGTVIIEFYANDTLGNLRMNSTTVRKDILGPIVTINNPTPNELFFSTAPGVADCDVLFNDVSGIDAQWHMLINATDSTHYTENYTWNGQVNQTAWNQMGNGTVIIRIFANDSLDNIGMAEVIVRKDIEPPSIAITKPTSNEIFGNVAMNFTISVSGRNLDTIWYMLINGTNSNDYTNNITYSESVFEGVIEDTINYNLWNQFENGTVIIRFFLNRTTGPRAFDEILVRKDIIAPNITIIVPVANQTFIENDGPAAFIIVVREKNPHKMWYRLFNGTYYTENRTFSTNTTINGADWDKIWDSIGYEENFTIIFYCNDTAGNIGFANVTVIKSKVYLAPVIPPVSGDDDDGEKKAKEEPDIVIPVVIGIGVSGGIAAVVIIYFKKIKKPYYKY
ncbi:MAG: hypothetical protein EU529_04750 [Promethearchaeota archaeon]|nr:MAG: hypothetical protein EU529_04750 [Candidatus Lokiarchaeota archaeon]